MSLNETLWTKAEKLASRDYDIETFRDTLTNGDVVILAKHPELPGCMAHGATLEEALMNLKEARTEYIYSLLEDELPVPYPRAIATGTTVSTDYSVFVRGEVTVSGSAFERILDPETREQDLAISYRGNLVEQV